MKQIASYFISAAAAASMLLSANAQTGKKVVLLEQYTGAWCGWCVEGTTFMNDLEEEYGDRFIGVKIHQGDDMQVNSVWQPLSGLVDGFPSGSVDRKSYLGNVALGRDTWKEVVASRMESEAMVDVSIKKLDYNPDTRQLTATVSGKMLKDIKDELRFNLYVIEDSVSGTGEGYDQRNFLANRAGFESNEYFKKPALLVGYQHMAVVRDIIGGVLGQPGSVPASRTVGESYDYTFTYTLPAGYKAWHTKVIASMYKYVATDLKKNEILNSVESEVLSNLPRFIVPNITENVTFSAQSGMVNSAEPSKKIFSITNPTSEEVTFNLVIANAPQGIDVAFTESEVKVASNSTKTVEVVIKSNSLVSCFPIEVTVIPIKKGFQGVSATSNMWFLTDNAKGIVFYGLASNFLAQASYNAMQTANETKDKTALVPLIPDAMKNFDFKGVDVAIFDMGNGGALDLPDTEGTPIKVINTLLENNKKVMVTGERLLTNLQGNAYTEEYSEFYSKTLGVDLNLLEQRYQGNQLKTFKITAVKDDIIAGTLNVTANSVATNESYSLFTESLFLLPGTKSKPIVYFNDDEEQVGAVRYEDGQKRILYFGFSPICISNAQTRNTLMNNSIKWLIGTISSTEELDNAISTSFATPNPSTGNSVTLSFESTVETTSSISIINALGQNVQSLEKVVHNGTNTVNVNTSSLSNGAYTAVTNINGNTVRVPFVIAK